MYITKKNIITSFALMGTLLFSACSSKDINVENHKFEADITGLVLKANSPSLIYSRPGAKSLSEYKQFFIDPIKVKYINENEKKLDKKQIKKLQEYFHTSMVTKLKDNGYIVVKTIIPNTMRISFTISGIKAPNPVVNVISVLAPIAPSVGEVTVEGKFINTTSNQIDAVVVNKSQGSKVLNTTPWSTWADIESSFDQWSEGIVKSINK